MDGVRKRKPAAAGFRFAWPSDSSEGGFGTPRVALQNDAGVFHFHNDHLGLASVVVDDGGALVARQTYYPFGGIRTSEGTSPTDYGFTGQRFDASSLLMYYGARYYDPVLGRFTRADPMMADAWNPQGLNRYAYVYNNPVRYTDPSGHCVPELFTLVRTEIRSRGYTSGLLPNPTGLRKSC